MTNREEKIFDLFKNRACAKQDVYIQAKKTFKWLDNILSNLADEYAIKAHEN